MDGYFDGILVTLDVMVERGFLRQEDRDRVVAAETAEALLEAMAAWQVPETLKFTLAR